MADESLEGALTHIPGLSEYLAMKQYLVKQDQAQQQRGLQQQFIQDRSALGSDAKPEDFIALGMRNADPKTLVQYGQASQDRQAATAARLQQTRELIDYRMQDLEARREASTARLKDKESQDAVNNYFRGEQLKLQQHQSDVMAELKRMGLDVQKDKVDQAGAAKSDKTVQQLGTALERANLPEADSVIRGVEDALKKTPTLAEYLSGPKSMIPDAVLPLDIGTGRQAFQKLFNITLKNRSGAAVTVPEFERLKQEFATGVWKSPEQLKAGVEQARKIISDHYRSVSAGFGTDALNSYNENLRQTGGTPILEPQGGAQPAAKVPAPAQRQKDTVYQTPRGPMKWTGTGWLPPE
jgi:hypothetical protein